MSAGAEEARLCDSSLGVEHESTRDVGIASQRLIQVRRESDSSAVGNERDKSGCLIEKRNCSRRIIERQAAGGSFNDLSAAEH
jgi:hypothetical protein